METSNELGHEMFVFIAHAKSHSLNRHCQLPSGASCLNIGLNIYIYPFYVCTGSEGSGDAAPKGRCV